LASLAVSRSGMPNLRRELGSRWSRKRFPPPIFCIQTKAIHI
jgi:hypothetical protein